MTTILLVCDDPLQASLMISLLGRQFGDVCRVSDAAEALCLIEQPDFAGKLGLVITAHHTPGIGVSVFVAELRTRMPRVPVLILGPAEAVPPGSEFQDEGVVYLSRQVGGEKMLAVTGQMLSERKSVAAEGSKSFG